MIRRRLMVQKESSVNEMEKILDVEFTLDSTIITSAYTTIAAIDTGLSAGDLKDGEVLIAEIRMIEDMETDDTLVRQNDRFEFLTQGESGYYYIGHNAANPTYGKANNVEKYSTYMSGSTGVFLYQADRYLTTVKVAGRKNGLPDPVAGRYQLLIYRTGFNIFNDYRV